MKNVDEYNDAISEIDSQFMGHFITHTYYKQHPHYYMGRRIFRCLGNSTISVNKQNGMWLGKRSRSVQYTKVNIDIYCISPLKALWLRIAKNYK